MNRIVKIHQHHTSSLLEIHFSDGFNAFISYELLRVYSPCSSPEHHFSQSAPLVCDKAFVRLIDVQLTQDGASFYFDDGHRSRLYAPDYLYHLCKEQDELWLSYLNRSKIAKQARNDSIICLQLG